MATAACAVAGVLAGGAEVAVVVAGAVVLPGAAERHSRGCSSIKSNSRVARDAAATISTAEP